ncbi:NAD-dependent epimerase/dehydratase family protein [Colwellia demingiae]|uniref:NAD-dependent epimerase/dehydratase family protein n=1 Tax=Colwellia demingiae TaxID=89401 RepID=A0A5C6QS55_9GAMM|nr:NAD-dependent epimerase/dehydratase family protein [Colwellia demingiae]TWX71925.1 NAD-dependent epimerase/dehydratase family protein [Colwellia demingiae]
MKKKVLVTGAKGFIGSNVVKFFKTLGYETFGIGHGQLSEQECKVIDLDYWFQDDVSIEALRNINEKFDVIVHCAGSGSVGFSVNHPYQDFKKTVDGTLELLEYIRLFNKNTYLIYPSSPSVQGQTQSTKISETDVGIPISPYGYHKKIAEELCDSYSKQFGISVAIIRLFSIYGIGLQKQLLWDACSKVYSDKKGIVDFFGTGEESRDFVHISDVLKLIECILKGKKEHVVVNCGTGYGVTIHDVVHMVNSAMDKNPSVIFNNKVDLGNPKHYCADISTSQSLGWMPCVSFQEGLTEYVDWFMEQKND